MVSLLLPIALALAQVAADPVTAEERYVAELRARIAQGDVDAEVALGNLYEAGGATLPLDPPQAAAWYRRAAEKGHAGAQLNLALMYLDGYGVARDAAAAFAWYERAASHGDPIAQYGLGELYESGTEGIAPDRSTAAQWYRRAADQGLSTAQHRLGLLFRDGGGVGRDEAQAIAWLRKAAEGGNPDAQLELGILLSPGRGPSADIVEAHAWLNLAASLWKDDAKRVRAVRLRDQIEEAMTPAQRSDAYRRASEWQDAHAWGDESKVQRSKFKVEK